MTRTNPKSEGAARRSAAASGVSLPLDASVAAIVADLEGHDFTGLCRQWRNHLGGEAPSHLPRWLLLRVLAHRLQTAAFGDIDKSVRRIIRGGGDPGACAPFHRPLPPTGGGGRAEAGAVLR